MLDWENKCFQSKHQFLLSPLLSSTILWFCERIISTYFFRVKRISDGVDAPTPRSDNTAESFISCFHSLPLYNQFLELVVSNLERWSGNEEVLLATTKLFRTFCATNRLSYKLTGLSGFNKIISAFSSWSLDQIPAPFHRKIISSIFIARISENSNVCDSYYTTILSNVMNLVSMIQKPNFVFHEYKSVMMCGALLEKLNGLIDGTNTQNVKKIRMFMFSCLPGFSKLMEVYKTDSSLYVPLVRLCTRFVMSQADQSSSTAWVTSELNTIFDMSMAIIRFCRGAQVLQKNGHGLLKGEEKEQYQLIRRLILLLIALLQLVRSSGNSNDNKESQVDVILFGLAALLGHISENLLDYPKLKKSYYTLLKRLLNVYPERFGLLPPDLFKRLMTTLMFGFKSDDESVQKCVIKGFKELFSSHAKYGVLKDQQAMNSGVIVTLVLCGFELLLQKGAQSRLIDGCAVMLLSLLASDRGAWKTAIGKLASQASSSTGSEVVLRSCSTLVEGLSSLQICRENEEKFRESLKTCIAELRGIEWNR